jgi:hypothetical protein
MICNSLHLSARGDAATRGGRTNLDGAGRQSGLIHLVHAAWELSRRFDHRIKVECGEIAHEFLAGASRIRYVRAYGARRQTLAVPPSISPADKGRHPWSPQFA